MGSASRGDVIGRYEILVPLTVGGMAELFLASTTGPGGFRKYVVLKRILPHAAKDEGFVQMFLDEARITAAFTHPNIVQVYELGEDTNGLYVAMEFIAGQNLVDVVTACSTTRQVLPVGFSVSVVHDCALALHYAHTFKKPSGEEWPVIHRDVAQKNIMVGYDGQVKLLDFGIAKARGALSSTKAGTVKGTAGYMSPEQIRGEPLDGRSDVFALGVVLWEMVTGQRLFSAETEVKEMQLILTGPIRSPRELEAWVTPALEQIILRALARDRTARFATAKELAKALTTQVPELLFDADQRAAFMGTLFAGPIVEAQALFDAANHPSNSVQFNAALKAFESDQPTNQQPGKRVRTKPADIAAKSSKKDVDDELLKVSLEAERLAATPSSPGRTWSGSVFAGVVVLVVLAIGYRLLIADRAPASSGLQRFPGEPTEEELAASNQAHVPIPGVEARPLVLDAGVAPVPPVEVINTGTSPITLPVDPPKAPVAPPPPTVKSSGTITLALLPEASLSLGRKFLNHGTLMELKLPVGTHLVTVVGPDGLRRKLSLQVGPGKNKPLRFNVTDLPEE